MKKFFAYICLLSLSVISVFSITNAQTKNKSRWHNKLYIKGDIGAVIPANKFKEKEYYLPKELKKGAVYNIGLGYNIINDIFRSSLDFSYRNLKYKASDGADFLHQKISTYSIFINAYLDLKINKIIVPYLTIGAGYSRNKSSDLVDSGPMDERFPGTKRNNFAWNTGVGARFIINDKVNLDLSCKYVDLGKIAIKDSETRLILPDLPGLQGTSQKIRSYEITGGVIFYF